MKILFTGGGSGGHAIPIIAIVREIRKINPKTKMDFFFIGPKNDMESVLLVQEGINIKEIFTGKIRRYGGIGPFFNNLFDVLIKIPIGVFQAFLYIYVLGPDVLFSKGGYGSVPAVIAAKLLWVPIFLHESDINPGLSNRLMSKFALEIFVSFPKTEYFSYEKMFVVGNPVRRELLEGNKEQARSLFKINSDKPVLLVMGGSQGAQRINEKILNILPKILEHFELILQCGENNLKQVTNEAKMMIKKEQEQYFHLFAFLQEPELKQAYTISDFIVSRAGAGTIFEIAAMNKPSILIPLPESAQNHQIKNAYAYGETGAAIVLEEDNFTGRFFLERLKDLFFVRSEELEKMSKLAKEFSKPLAAKIIAEYLCSYLID